MYENRDIVYISITAVIEKKTIVRIAIKICPALILSVCQRNKTFGFSPK